MTPFEQAEAMRRMEARIGQLEGRVRRLEGRDDAPEKPKMERARLSHEAILAEIVVLLDKPGASMTAAELTEIIRAPRSTVQTVLRQSTGRGRWLKRHLVWNEKTGRSAYSYALRGKR